MQCLICNTIIDEQYDYAAPIHISNNDYKAYADEDILSQDSAYLID